MTTSLIVLQDARDRLCSEPLGKKYNPQNFCGVMRAYLQALCKNPKGESLLTQYGECIQRSTALVTQYALARQQGLASVLEILPVLKSVDKHTAASDFSPAAILHWEALQDTRTLRKKRALQNRRTLVSYLPELKEELNRIKKVRSLLDHKRGDVVDALVRGPKVDGEDSNEQTQQKEPGQNEAREKEIGQEEAEKKEAEKKEAEKNIGRIRSALKAWWSKADSLICSAENCHADGCRIMLQMHRLDLDAGENVVVEDKEVGAAIAATVQAAARFLAKKVAEKEPVESAPAQLENGILVEAAEGEVVGTTPPNKADDKSTEAEKRKKMTKAEAEIAIRKYIIDNQARYDLWKWGASTGDARAVKHARKVFGRNSLVNEFKCSCGTVSATEIWQEIKQDLGFDKPAKIQRLTGKKIGLDIALEEASGQVGDTTASEVELRDTIRLVEKDLPAGEASEVVARLNVGDMSVDDALSLINIVNQQKADAQSDHSSYSSVAT